LPVRRQPGQRPLTLLLMPLEQTIEPGIKQAPVALLFIGDPERSVSFDQTRIARLYGLSRAESRVAALLASGYRLEQVAESLDIAYETVRKHLKQIFGKTGTYRQAELVRMLVTGPAGLSI
jgi:DNA-binding CsgD family transcriptional regulator